MHYLLVRAFSYITMLNANIDKLSLNDRLNLIFFVFQLWSWFTELKAELSSEEVAETAENAERLLEQFSTQVQHFYNLLVLVIRILIRPSMIRIHTVPKSDLWFPRNESAQPCSQILHSCIFERFIYSQDRSAYLAATIQADRLWEYINR